MCGGIYGGERGEPSFQEGAVKGNRGKYGDGLGLCGELEGCLDLDELRYDMTIGTRECHNKLYHMQLLPELTGMCHI